MKPKPPKSSYVATLGLTAALLSGGCGGPAHRHAAPGAVLPQMSPEEQARAGVLRSLYGEVRASILKHSSEELASLLQSMEEGILAKREEVSYFDGHPKDYLCICGPGASGNIDLTLHIYLAPLARDIKSLRERSISPPTMMEIRDVFVQAILSALMDEKYENLEVTGFNVQKLLKNEFSGKLIEERVSSHVIDILTHHVPESWTFKLESYTPDIGR
jgi:hypothetical protein